MVIYLKIEDLISIKLGIPQCKTRDQYDTRLEKLATLVNLPNQIICIWVCREIVRII